MIKRLYKSKDNKVLAGVLGGLGEYFDLDPILLRVIYLFTAAITAVVPSIIAYIIAAAIIPKKPESAEPAAHH
jgi:phage shock protein C